VRDGVINRGSLNWTGNVLTIGKQFRDFGDTRIFAATVVANSGIIRESHLPFVFSVGTYSGAIEGPGTMIAKRNLDNWNVRTGMDVVVENVEMGTVNLTAPTLILSGSTSVFGNVNLTGSLMVQTGAVFINNFNSNPTLTIN
jgi:hypothetical protein